MKIAICWFRRDLRLEDQAALHHALASGFPVLPLFIFDENILQELPRNDARLNFIYDRLQAMHTTLRKQGASVLCIKGEPIKVLEEVLERFEVEGVYLNKDYEPYARERDGKVAAMLEKRGIGFHAFKDQVIFEENEVLKQDGKPYTVFTPYRNKWMEHFRPAMLQAFKAEGSGRYFQINQPFPTLSDIGFEASGISVRPFDLSRIDAYKQVRDLPAEDATSRLSPHLRFGTVSIRAIMNKVYPRHEAFMNELIWREFFMQILFHFPAVVNGNFKSKYDGIEWRNDEADFKRWCEGNTGYPMVDAGMRELNQTGFMHNRVRMVVASFLCKHLLIDWRWGEAYFAEKLLDYELSSNNGNWQWAAGTGCDAAPYFRVFNPTSQMEKFDKGLDYVKKWVPEYGTDDYASPMVEHRFARERALREYKIGLTRQ